MKRTLTGLLSLSVLFSATPLLAQRRSVSPTLQPQPKASSTDMLVKAMTEGNGVFITWQIQVDTNAIGFNVYRISAKGREMISPQLIPGPAMQNGVKESAGSSFSFFDRAGVLGDVYTVETNLMSGRLENSSAISATYVSDLSAASGRDISAYYADRSASAPDLQTSAVDLPEDLRAEVQANRKRPGIKTQLRIAAVAGVKIGIKKSGMYRVTRAQLETAGFDVASDPSLWSLYVDGNEQAINVDPAGNFIEFYATAINTIETDVRMYYLSVGVVAGKRLESRVSRTISGSIPSHHYNQTYSNSERTSYINTILNGDADNWWGRAVGSTAVNYNFTLSGIDYSVLSNQLRISLYGFTTGSHAVKLILNGTEIGSAIGFGQAPVIFDNAVLTSLLVEGQNVLEMSTIDSADSCLFDTVQIQFPRRYLADQGALSFYTENYRQATLEGFTSSNVRLFDVTHEGELAEYNNLRVNPDGESFDLLLPAARGRVFYAVQDDSILSPFSIETNNASSLRSTNHNAELIIISHKDYLTQAEAWADYRRGQGINVEVVDIDDVYDEFSFGVKGWHPINAFLNYAKTTWQTTPGYVLLIGGTTPNPKQYDLPGAGPGYPDYVPTKIVNTVYTETGSDEALGDFNDDGLSDIAIGRITARRIQDVTNAFNKTVLFETNPSSLARGVMFASDVDPLYDFGAVSARLRDQLPAGTQSTMILKTDPGAQAAVISSINSGKYMVNYTGHGTIGVWSAATFFGNPSILQLTNSANPSVFTMLTCLNGYFLNMYTGSLAENLLQYNSTGAAASWASTGKTTPDVQEIMATRFYLKLGEGNIHRLGDLILDAKGSLPDAHDVRLSWVLLGDPMLKMN